MIIFRERNFPRKIKSSVQLTILLVVLLFGGMPLNLAIIDLKLGRSLSMTLRSSFYHLAKSLRRDVSGILLVNAKGRMYKVTLISFGLLSYKFKLLRKLKSDL